MARSDVAVIPGEESRFETPGSFSGSEVGGVWKWRDRYGVFHRPADMETRHLFHVIRMIWNNTVPWWMRVGRVRLYTFHSFYTVRYRREAVRQIGAELYRRRDLTDQWKAELREMESWFSQWEDVEDARLAFTRRLEHSPVARGSGPA